MDCITETNTLNTAFSCDVCVAGGGVAGIAAALSAARNGADVILLEKEFILGGLATAGLITIYLPLDDGEGMQVSFGIAEELLKLSIQYGAEAKYPKAWLENGSFEEKKNGPRFEVQFNPHLFAISAEQLLLKEGVRILYGTSVCGVQKDGGRISHVIIENKSGRQGISVRTVVDATGDADVCHLAGENTAEFQQGNLLAGWYYYVNEKGLSLRQLGASDVPEEYKAKQNSPKPLIDRRFKGLDGAELSEMVCLSHGQILDDILKRRKSGETLVPVTIPTIPQIRMTRRICGMYTMDDKEIRKDFADSCGMFSDWRKRGPSYQLPFGTLHGEKVENLIAAGRCISVTDSMWDITRVIPVCAVSGEAAGTAAAMTDNFKTLDISKLQSTLKEKGVHIK